MSQCIYRLIGLLTVLPVVLLMSACQPCPAIVNPNHNDWTFANIELSNDDAELLGEHLGDVTDRLSRSIFLAGETPIAAYIQQALKLVETEKNVRVLEQINASLVSAVDMMQRLRPETDETLPRVLRDIEELSVRRAQFAETQDLKQMWLNTFLEVVSTDSGLSKTRTLLDGKTQIDGMEISPEIRWKLLIILSRHGVDGIAGLLAAEIERDAVISELFPATQTDLQLKVLEKLLS